jgi:hypothetical protein
MTDSNDDGDFPFDLNTPEGLALWEIMDRNATARDLLEGPDRRDFEWLMSKVFDQIPPTEEQKQKSEEFIRSSLEFKENIRRAYRESRERRNDPPPSKLKPGRQVDDVRSALLQVVLADVENGTQTTKAIKRILHLVPGDATDESKIEWFERKLRGLRHSGR